MLRRALIAGVAALAMTGCAGSGGPDAPSPSLSTVQPTDTPPPPPPPAPTRIAWGGPEVLEDDSTVPLAATAVPGPGGFVAHRGRTAAWEAGPTSALYASSDGQSWEQVFETAGLRVDGLLAGGPGYVAVGTRYLPAATEDLNLAPWAAWSRDGRSWEEADLVLPGGVGGGVARGGPGGPAHDGGVVTVVTLDGPVIAGSWLGDLVATDGGLVALGHSQESGRRNILWTSSDGKAWSPLPTDPFGGEATVRRLASGAGGYVAYGNAETPGDYPGAVLVWRSDDAVTWEPAQGDDSFADEYGGGPLVAGVVAFGDGFVMVGMEFAGWPLAWASTDGRRWGPPARLPSLTDNSADVLAVAASDSFVVATGREVTYEEDPARQYPAIWTSTDGADWIRVPPDELRGDRAEVGISVDSVAWVGDHWLALGHAWDYPDEIATGIAWTGR